MLEKAAKFFITSHENSRLVLFVQFLLFFVTLEKGINFCLFALLSIRENGIAHLLPIKHINKLKLVFCISESRYFFIDLKMQTKKIDLSLWKFEINYTEKDDGI